MLKKFFAAMLICIFAACNLFLPSPVLASDWSEYYDKETDTSLLYPSDWYGITRTVEVYVDDKLTGTKTVVTFTDPDSPAQVIFKKNCSLPLKAWGRDDVYLTKVTKLDDAGFDGATYLVEAGSNMSVYCPSKSSWKPGTGVYAPKEFFPVISMYDGVCSLSSSESLYPFVYEDKLSSSEQETVRKILSSFKSGRQEDIDDVKDTYKNIYLEDGYYDADGDWHDYTYDEDED